MKQEMYDAMFAIEQTHWWFRAKREIVEQLLISRLSTYPKDYMPQILDAGCGCGLMLQSLQHFGEVSGADYSQTAIDYCRLSFPGKLFSCDLGKPIQLDQTFDVIVALDVLEHIADDRTAMKNISAALNPGGVVILTVPAHPWLWSRHDENCMHQRRYTKASLAELCHSTELHISLLSYYDCWLLAPVALVRLAEKVFGHNTPSEKTIENQIPSSLINDIFYRIFRSDGNRLSRNKTLPWGVSLIAVLTSDESDGSQITQMLDNYSPCKNESNSILC